MHLDELKKRYNLQDYHIIFAMTAEIKVGLRGKRVLEVGGSLPKDFVFNELGVKQWIAVEQIDYWDGLPIDTGGPDGTPPKGTPITKLADVIDFNILNLYEVLSGGVEELPIALHEKFDVIFSIAAFEHIGPFPLALDKMYQALHGGGHLFSMWSPIWSAHNGHHLPTIIDKSGRSFSFVQSPVPPWGHLFMQPLELYRYLLNLTDQEAAARILYYLCNSSHINRFFVEDYLGFMEMSKFDFIEVTGYDETMVPPDIQTKLEGSNPGHKNFSHNGIMAILQRS